MAKNITLMGANYPGVPAVVLPQTGGGNAIFVDADDVASVEEAIAIVINGDTAPKAISSGQYLFIKNHSTLATGGYHATVNISSGGTVSSSNVAVDAEGITNAINDKIVNVTSSTIAGNHASGKITLTKLGKIRILHLTDVTVSTDYTELNFTNNLDSGDRPYYSAASTAIVGQNTGNDVIAARFFVRSNGTSSSKGLKAGYFYNGTVCWFVQ